MEVTLEKEGIKTITVVEGVRYDLKKLSTWLGLHPVTASKTYQRYRTDEKRIDWVKKKIWLRDNGFAPNTAVYHRDGFYITAQQISKQANIQVEAAFLRGRNFEAGKTTKEQLLKPRKKKKYQKKTYGARWGKLTNKRRDKNLAKIPSATNYDEEFAGQHVGQCLPGLANNAFKQT